MTANSLNIQHLIISRTDAIGDVVLTLPMCGYIKAAYPHIKISFLGRTYTGPVIKNCAAVDDFINYDELIKLPADQQINMLASTRADAIVHVFPNKHIARLASKAAIKYRIGTTNRLYHWLTCNKLVKLSRKNSALHEAQLNIALLRPLALPTPPLHEVYKYYAFNQAEQLPAATANFLSTTKFNLILHPKSHGSGVEWTLEKFKALIEILPSDKFNILISGSDKEKVILKDWLPTLPAYVKDITGSMNLYHFITFVRNADGLVASGTGPLHIAAACGIHTLGLFPCIKPIHPGRWAPLGAKATYLESDSENLTSISAQMVADKIIEWL